MGAAPPEVDARPLAALSSRAESLLRCPKCRQTLVRTDVALTCEGCKAVYPVVDGVPVLINEENSVFTLSDFTGRRQTTFGQPSPLKRLARRLLPELSVNPQAAENLRTVV